MTEGIDGFKLRFTCLWLVAVDTVHIISAMSSCSVMAWGEKSFHFGEFRGKIKTLNMNTQVFVVTFVRNMQLCRITPLVIGNVQQLMYGLCSNQYY